jgi:hypothetical protein
MIETVLRCGNFSSIFLFSGFLNHADISPSGCEDPYKEKSGIEKTVDREYFEKRKK